MSALKHRLTFSNVVAVLALFVALGGGAYALSLSKNSVKSKHIKDGQVKAADLKANAVDGSKLKDGGVAAADVGSDALTGGQVDESTLTLPSGAVGPTQLAEQPHVAVRRIAAQAMPIGGKLAWDRIDRAQGFTVEDDGDIIPQVGGLYFVDWEGYGADHQLVTGTAGDATFGSFSRRNFSRLVRLTPDSVVRIQNAEAAPNSVPAGSEIDPAAQLIIVRVGS